MNASHLSAPRCPRSTLVLTPQPSTLMPAWFTSLLIPLEQQQPRASAWPDPCWPSVVTWTAMMIGKWAPSYLNLWQSLRFRPPPNPWDNCVTLPGRCPSPKVNLGKTS